MLLGALDKRYLYLFNNRSDKSIVTGEHFDIEVPEVGIIEIQSYHSHREHEGAVGKDQSGGGRLVDEGT